MSIPDFTDDLSEEYIEVNSIAEYDLDFIPEAYRRKSYGEILNYNDIDDSSETVNFIIDDILGYGQTLLISGPSKCGKSFLALNIAVAVSAGATIFGKSCQKSRVLYVEFENGAAETKKRIKNILAENDLDNSSAENVLVFRLSRGFIDSCEDFFDELIEKANGKECDLIILDPIYMLLNGDENNSEVIKNFFKQVSRLRASTGAAIILCHHESKGKNAFKNVVDRACGSGVLSRYPDALISLEPVNKNNINKIKIGMVLRYHESPDPFIVNIRNGAYPIESNISSQRKPANFSQVKNDPDSRAVFMINAYESLKEAFGKVTVTDMMNAIGVSSVNTAKCYIDKTPGFSRDSKGTVTFEKQGNEPLSVGNHLQEKWGDKNEE